MVRANAKLISYISGNLILSYDLRLHAFNEDVDVIIIIL